MQINQFPIKSHVDLEINPINSQLIRAATTLSILSNSSLGILMMKFE